MTYVFRRLDGRLDYIYRKGLPFRERTAPSVVRRLTRITRRMPIHYRSIREAKARIDQACN